MRHEGVLYTMSSWVTNEDLEKVNAYRWAKQQDIYLTEYHGYIA
jgi:hypothetical protein